MKTARLISGLTGRAMGSYNIAINLSSSGDQVTTPEALHYIWEKLPLILLFAGGYLIYRMLAVTGLAEAMVLRVMKRVSGSISLLLLAVMVSSALLSFFIPNAVTVLTLLPILRKIDSDFGGGTPGTGLTTSLALAVIYGANAGGMGSLIGSPANLLLLGALDLYQVPGREQITFFNWFLWSVPLVTVIVGIGWLIVSRSVPVHVRRQGMERFAAADPKPLSPWQRSAAVLFVMFLAFWISSAVAVESWPAYRSLEPACAIGFFLFFVFMLFFRASSPCQGTDVPILRFSDLFTGLPRRGIAFLGLLLVIIGLARWFRLDEYLAGFMNGLLEPDWPSWMIFGVLVLAVIFLTEAFSNTVISVSFFSIAFFLAQARGMSPLALMIAVSAASTCAFMTPIATPCNALAFGEMRGVSLRAMILLGLVMNMVTAAMMTFWLEIIIPVVYISGAN